MRPTPSLHALHVLWALVVVRILQAPLPMTLVLAGHLAFGLPAVPLPPGISRMRLVPNPAMATLSESLRTHRLPPTANREEYEKRPYVGRPITRHTGRAGIHNGTAKKEENDPYWIWEGTKKTNLSRRPKKSHFKTAFTGCGHKAVLACLDARGSDCQTCLIRLSAKGHDVLPYDCVVERRTP